MKTKMLMLWFGLMVGMIGSAFGAEEPDVVVVGSKNFGESYLLAEIAAQVLEAKGFDVVRQLGLGGTLI